MKKNKKKEGKKEWDDSHLCLDNAKSIGRKIKKWKINKNREMTVKKKNEIAMDALVGHHHHHYGDVPEVPSFIPSFLISSPLAFTREREDLEKHQSFI